jgi:hypothetical protein
MVWLMAVALPDRPSDRAECLGRPFTRDLAKSGANRLKAWAAARAGYVNDRGEPPVWCLITRPLLRSFCA